ncbi:MAG: hypothetical protein ACRDJE_17065 [Dehalococcoidia bacterium]
MEDWWRANRASLSGRLGAATRRLQLADLRIGVEVGRLLAYPVAWMHVGGAGGAFCSGLDLDAFAEDPPPP